MAFHWDFRAFYAQFPKASPAACLTFGLLPPMAPGLMEPVSWYRQRILETQPWDTRSWREITQGRIPWWAISTILWRMWLGRGLPFMKTPPSWLTRPCPNGVETGQHCVFRLMESSEPIFVHIFINKLKLNADDFSGKTICCWILFTTSVWIS